MYTCFYVIYIVDVHILGLVHTHMQAYACLGTPFGQIVVVVGGWHGSIRGAAAVAAEAAVLVVVVRGWLLGFRGVFNDMINKYTTKSWKTIKMRTCPL